MPDPFFAAGSKKRKRPSTSAYVSRKKPATADGKLRLKRPSGAQQPKKRIVRDEDLSDATGDDHDIEGVDDMDLRASDEDPYQSGSENENETPAEKRLRLAQMYLEGVKTSLAEGEYDAAEIDKELISARLKQDVLEQSGKIHLFVADSYDFEVPPISLRTRGHRFTVTTAAVSENGKSLYTAGKEGSIIKWDLCTGKKLSTAYKQKSAKGKQKADPEGHTDEIWTLALSSDGKYLASGGKDRIIGVWNVENTSELSWVKGFTGHRDSISCLAFRKSSQQLFSGSYDRTVKLFDLSVMGYVETLFGHQDFVTSIDSLRGETAVTCGGRDRTVRYWKIVDETQLVFRGGGRSKLRDLLEGGAFEGMDADEKRKMEEQKTYVEGSMEVVCMIDETTFLSGGDSGSISLWSTQRKKPTYVQALAHGLHETVTEERGTIASPRWITAIGSLRYSDLFASGSWDGQIKLWKLDQKLKSFSLVGCVNSPGVVNSIQLLAVPKSVTYSWGETKKDSVLLVAGVGQETRTGRWIVVKGSGSFNGSLSFVFSPRT